MSIKVDLVLFRDHGQLETFLQKRLNRLRVSVDSVPPDRFLNASEVDLGNQFAQATMIQTPVLSDDASIHHSGETLIDVTGWPGRDDVYGRRNVVRGTRIVIEIPFTGDSELFRLHPRSGYTVYPRATLYSDKLHLTYEVETPDAGAVRGKWQADRDLIARWLECTRTDVDQFHSRIERFAQETVAARKSRLLAERDMVAALGIPVKRRDSERDTYAIPELRKRVTLTPSTTQPEPSRQPFQPEPAMADAIYEEILSTLDNMALAMERTPSEFARIKEEALRNHFLVQLNARWEAGGETFNREGKTDILLRYNERAAFIAECKFWRSPKTITESLDQLLGYLSWRDTKAALLLFVRNKPLSAVLNAVPSLVERHPSHKASRGNRGETGFRYVFGQQDDPNRDIILTVMLFAVPAVTAVARPS